MVEATLSLTFNELYDDVARYLGYKGEGRTADLTSNEESNVIDCIRKGLRQFYRSHNWSFLVKTATLSLTSSSATYDLPYDFADIQGSFSFDGDDGYDDILLTTKSKLDHWSSYNNSTGIPQYAAIYPKSSTPSSTAGQRWQVEFYPQPQGSYTINYIYKRLCNMISSDNPYPLGGQKHSEAIRLACLAVVDREYNRERTVVTEDYEQELQKSIEVDKAAGGPVLLGYNGDPSVELKRVNRRLRGGLYHELNS